MTLKFSSVSLCLCGSNPSLMKFYLLPFGAPAWAARREILREIITARPGPPHDFRDVLCLVPNGRSVSALRALSLEVLCEATGARACIPPSIETMNRFLERRAFAASARPVIDRLARELVIEEICARLAPGFPTVRVGPSLSAMLAESMGRLYLYGARDEAWRDAARDSLPSSLLLAAKYEYEKWLNKKGLADPSAALAAYRPAPGDFAFRTVVLDGFYDADPAELRLLKALAGLPDARFLLSSPGLDAPGACGEGRPYFGTDRLLSELGLAGEASGGEAGREAALLIGALFTGRPLVESCAEALNGVAGRINIVGAVNPTEEVYFIAREIKDRALAGRLDINRTLVFFPDPEPCLPAVEQAFADYGIPYHISLGRPLIQTPAAKALLYLLALPSEDYSFRPMRKVFFSSALPFGDAAAGFDSAARKKGITGKREQWERLARNISVKDQVLAQALNRLLDITRPLEDGGPRSARAWAEVALSLLENVNPEAEGLAEVFKSLKKIIAKAAPAEGALSIGEFAAFLKRRLRESRIRVGSGDVSGVRVLGRGEVFSEPFDVIFAAGLVEGAMPSPRRADVFMPDALAKRLGLPGSFEPVSRDARLFLGLVQSAPEVFLLYPESSAKGVVPPSPYIAALEPLLKAGAVHKTGRWQRPDLPQEAMGVGELTRTLALRAGEHNAKTLIAEAREKVPDFTWPETTPDAETDAAAGMFRDRQEFSVTELEEYIRCGYRCYLLRSLGRPPEDPEEDMGAGDLGSLVHEVLRDFVEARRRGEGEEDPLRMLAEIGEKRFDDLPATAFNTDRKRWFMESLAPGFVEAEEALKETGYAVAGTERALRVPVESDGETFVLTGKIDRLEIDSQGNFNVVDYKTGRYPNSEKNQFQLPLYAYMVKAYGEDDAKRPAGFVYYGLKSDRMRDVVCYDKDVSSGPKRRDKTADEMDALILACLEKAICAVKAIRAGEFRPEPADKNTCRYCEFTEQCGKGEADGAEDGGEKDGQDEG